MGERKKTKAKNAGKPQKLSNILRPEKMTLEEWQTALRKQAAQEEMLAVTEDRDTDETGCYEVKNPLTRHNYKVIYRGESSPWNYCSCMDFKSNQLGTCKHLEAVALWMKNRGKKPVTSLPPYTSVYLSYKETRKVCIRIGTDCQEEFSRLAGEYFTPEGVLRPECIYSFSTFLSRARRISDTFRCYPDALEFVIDLRDEKRRERLVSEKMTDGYMNSLLKTSLYPYQKEGIRFTVKAGKSIIADEMGLGKTVQAIGCAEVLRKESMVSSVLIVCPTSLKYQWKKEIERFTGDEALVVEGGHTDRKRLYASDVFYKIVSYQSLCNDLKISGSLNTDLLIMDEAQRLKNWNTQIAREMRRIQAGYMVVLSGTPLENKLQELYSIVQLVNPYCLGPYYRFTDFTTVFSPSGQIVGYKNLNVIGNQLKGVLLRRRKCDVRLQLPARIDKNQFVPMTKEQRALHEEFHFTVVQIVTKWRKMHFLSENDRKRLLLLLSQMRMVCDSTYILDQHSRHDTKIEELMLLVEEMKENGPGKMVVFSQWERMTRLVCQELDKRGIGYANLHGGVPSAKRKDLMDRFTQDPDCRVFVSTDAGSTGLNLQAASILVNLDLPWNPAVLEQRIARIYRIGQENQVQAINLIAEKSIEEKMLSTLNFKANMSEGILDNGADSVFLDESQFNRLMETAEEVVEPEEKPAPETRFTETEEKEVPGQTEDSSPRQLSLFEEEEGTDAWEEEKKKDKEEDSPENLVTQGMSFLEKLADTLSSPEKTEALVEALVKEDKETGKAHLEIPVPDKESVKKLFTLFAGLKNML